jgi:hypothetical protein
MIHACGQRLVVCAPDGARQQRSSFGFSAAHFPSNGREGEGGVKRGKGGRGRVLIGCYGSPLR